MCVHQGSWIQSLLTSSTQSQPRDSRASTGVTGTRWLSPRGTPRQSTRWWERHTYAEPDALQRKPTIKLLIYSSVWCRPILPVTDFVNTKLTAKVNRQLQDPIVIMTSSLPSWLKVSITYLMQCWALAPVLAPPRHWHPTPRGCSRVADSVMFFSYRIRLIQLLPTRRGSYRLPYN